MANKKSFFFIHTKTPAPEFSNNLMLTTESIALGKVDFSSGILKQPAFSLTAIRCCCQEAYSLAAGLNTALYKCF
jgi:hypothetical protein